MVAVRMRQDVRGHGVFICACHMSKFDNTNVPSSPHHVIGNAVADPVLNLLVPFEAQYELS